MSRAGLAGPACASEATVEEELRGRSIQLLIARDVGQGRRVIDGPGVTRVRPSVRASGR